MTKSRMMSLADICDFQGGTHPPKSEWKKNPTPGYIRMLQIRDFTQGKDSFIEYVKDTGKLKTCNSDDILVGRYGASLGKVLTGLAGAYNVALMKFAPKDKKLDRRFLYYQLKGPGFQNFLTTVGTRAAQAGFNQDDLAKYFLPVPSLEEQKLFVNKLDTVSSALRKRENQLLLLDAYLRSLFIEMFGDPVTNPMGWKTSKIELAIDGIESGKNVNPQENDVPNGLRVLNVSAVTWGKFNWKESKPLPAEYRPANEAHYVRRGDFLFSRANTEELVGAVTIVDDVSGNILLPDKLWRVKWKNEVVQNFYALYLLRHPGLREKFSKSSSGSSGSMKNISQNKFISIEIPLPPQNVQKLFSETVQRVHRIIDAALKSRIEIENLFNAFLAESFSEGPEND